MVAYREACHVSVGKASLYVKGPSEGIGLKKLNMMINPGEYKF